MSRFVYRSETVAFPLLQTLQSHSKTPEGCQVTRLLH